jgi:hypothetical protein
MESEPQVRDQLHGPPAIKTANEDRRKIAKIFVRGCPADAQLARPGGLSKEAGKIDCNRVIGRRNNRGGDSKVAAGGLFIRVERVRRFDASDIGWKGA